MALTAAEQQELAELKRQAAANAPVAKGLTHEEAAELQALKKQATQPQYGLGQTALEHGTNAALMGYLPQVVGAMEPVTRKIGNLVAGEDIIQPESYVEQRDAMRQRLQDEATQNPKTALGSQIGGSLATAAATPFLNLGKASSIGGGIVRGAGAGMLQGAIQNPGDTQGVVDPIQLSDRAVNAAMGGVIGGVAGGVSEGTRKGLAALKKSPETLKDLAEGEAVKSSGAVIKDFRALEGKNRTNEVGRFMLDNKLVQAGDTVGSIAEKAGKLRQDTGEKLSGLYKGVVEDFNAGGAAAKLSKESQAALNDIGFNPARDKEKILSAVNKAMGNKEGKKAALQRLESYFDQLIEDHGDNVLDPKLSQEIKSEMDKVAGWARNPLTNQPSVEAAYKEARRVVSDLIDKEIETLGKLSNRPNALQELKSLNKAYGNAAQVEQFAADRTARDLANRRVSLTDTIAGSAGGVAGAGAGVAMGNDPLTAGGVGLATSLLAGGANHLGRKYGPGLIATGADRLSRGAKYVAPIGNAGLLIPRPGLISRGLVNLKDQEHGR